MNMNRFIDNLAVDDSDLRLLAAFSDEIACYQFAADLESRTDILPEQIDAYAAQLQLLADRAVRL